MVKLTAVSFLILTATSKRMAAWTASLPRRTTSSAPWTLMALSVATLSDAALRVHLEILNLFAYPSLTLLLL